MIDLNVQWNQNSTAICGIGQWRMRLGGSHGGSKETNAGGDLGAFRISPVF
jgi:hypothetical protein